MCKYTPAQLKIMACQFVTARIAGDERAFRLIMILSMVTPLSPDEIINRIEEFANA